MSAWIVWPTFSSSVIRPISSVTNASVAASVIAAGDAARGHSPGCARDPSVTIEAPDVTAWTGTGRDGAATAHALDMRVITKAVAVFRMDEA